MDIGYLCELIANPSWGRGRIAPRPPPLTNVCFWHIASVIAARRHVPRSKPEVTGSPQKWRVWPMLSNH